MPNSIPRERSSGRTLHSWKSLVLYMNVRRFDNKRHLSTTLRDVLYNEYDTKYVDNMIWYLGIEKDFLTRV